MSLIDRIFGRTGPAQRPSHSQPHAHSQPHSQSAPHSNLSSVHSQMTPQAIASQNATRRELLRVVLRDTLQRHGIPAAWIAAEVLSSTSRAGERGVHWRLMIKHWDPRLLVHGVALQEALIGRVMTFDPLSANWLNGISWQFALDDESACPPLPHPGAWTAPVAEPDAAPTIAEPLSSGDIIEGPVRLPTKGHEDAKADLDELLAIRDADFRTNGGKPPTWASTEPAKL